MQIRTRVRWVGVLAAITVCGLCAAAVACNVPVFRFALERWRPDPYRIVVFHQGELSADERELLRPLSEQQEKEAANIAVHLVDLAADDAGSEEAASDRGLYESLGKPALPWIVVEYPAYLRIPKPVWAGPLGRDLLATLLDSPVRREVAQRLADGQSAVWVLVEGGETGRDQAAAELIEEQLQLLQQTVKLPELTGEPEDAIDASLPLKLEFSLVRVTRNDPAEQALVATLLGSEPDLAERSDPMVFPVFGKGRALLPLIGAGITATNLEEAASFLAGPCSCEVKEQNPGFDLLMAADWKDLLSDRGVSLTAIETRHAPPTGEPQLVPIPAGAKSDAAGGDAVAAPEVARSGSGSWLVGALAVSGAVVLLMAFVALQSRA